MPSPLLLLGCRQTDLTCLEAQAFGTAALNVNVNWSKHSQNHNFLKEGGGSIVANEAHFGRKLRWLDRSDTETFQKIQILISITRSICRGIVCGDSSVSDVCVTNMDDTKVTILILH